MNPWTRPEVAQQQRQLVDAQLQQSPIPPHFAAFAAAISATQCPGEILEVGCGVGHGLEIFDRAGVEYRRYAGLDLSPEAIRIARERYPEADWACADFDASMVGKSDIVADSACLMHVDDWRAHLAALCAASRRWVILHRVPVHDGGQEPTTRESTHGYGQTFPAWRFGATEISDEMAQHGFAFVEQRSADGDSVTVTFAKPRHYASYADSNYLPRLKALHASMVRHCQPFTLHVLAWNLGADDAVERWCAAAGVDCTTIGQFENRHRDLWIDMLPGPKRTRVEHMWTCGPAFLASVMERTGEPVTYVDADVMFFSSPEPVFAEIGGAPAAVVPHGFAEASRGLPGPTRETHEVFGRFNVGIVYCADRAFVERWAEQCRAWCFDRIEEAHRTRCTPNADELLGIPTWYGDQKFLDEWPFQRAHIVQHPGACAGPWQVHTRALDVRDGVIYFGNRTLVSYHFSGYREGPHGQEQLTRPEYALTDRQAEIIYRHYIRALKETVR